MKGRLSLPGLDAAPWSIFHFYKKKHFKADATKFVTYIEISASEISGSETRDRNVLVCPNGLLYLISLFKFNRSFTILNKYLPVFLHLPGTTLCCEIQQGSCQYHFIALGMARLRCETTTYRSRNGRSNH